MITIICPCGKNIFTTPDRAKRKKYCSKGCFYFYRKRPNGLKYKIKVQNKTWFKKGHNAWNKGKKMLFEVWNKNLKGIHLSPNTEFRKGQNSKEENINWNGGIGSYRKWENKKGIEFVCSICGYKDKPNLVHLHHRDGNRKNNNRKNLEMLCIWCHLAKHLPNYSKKNALLNNG